MALRRVGWWLAIAVAGSAAARGEGSGVVVEWVSDEAVALRAGDVVTDWRWLAAESGARGLAGGAIRAPEELRQLVVELAARGGVELRGRRDGQDLSVTLSTRLRVASRPAFESPEKRLWQRARELESQGATQDEVLAIWQRLLSACRRQDLHAEAATVLHEMAILHGYKGGDRQEGIPLLEQAIAEARAAARPILEATMFYALGYLLGEIGEFERAREVGRRFLDAWQELWPDGSLVARWHTVIGFAAMQRGDLAVAESRFLRALELFRTLGPGSEELAMVWNNLAIIADARRDGAQSERYYKQALAIHEARDRDGYPAAQTRSNLALVLSTLGEHELAASYLERALATFETLGADLEVAGTIANLGEIANLSGDVDRAAEHFSRARDLIRKTAPRSPVEAAILKNLASVVTARGETERARRLWEEALALVEELDLGELEAAEIQVGLGEVALRGEEPERAVEHLRRAQRIFTELRPASVDLARTFAGLARAHRRRGRLAEARADFAAAVQALEEQAQRLAGSLRHRAFHFAAEHDLYQDYIDLLVELGDLQMAFSMLETSRGRGFLAMLAERQARGLRQGAVEVEASRLELAAEYDGLYAQLSRLTSEEEDVEERARLRSRLAELRYRLSELAGPAASKGRSGAASPYGAAEASRALDPGTVVLGFAVGANRSVLLVLAAGGELRAHFLEVDGASLRQRVERFRKLIERGKVDSRPAKVLDEARRLSDLLLAPAAAEIAAAERLLVLPDGPLHYLPFAALAAPDDGRFLIETKPLTVGASVSVFARLKTRRRPFELREIVAFGDPVYPQIAASDAEPTLRRALRGGLSLRRLEASRHEVETLGELFPRSARIFVGAAADEQAAKTATANVSVVHFATHAFLDERTPQNSSLALSRPETWREGEENGLLQVWEVLDQLQLDADLVTLSACNTSLGQEVAGEGLIGLARAFQYAGARTVVASLWAVEDRSTSELMRRFYTHLRNGESKGEALRRAQLELLRGATPSGDREPVDAAHPFHWAGFQLYGDPF